MQATQIRKPVGASIAGDRYSNVYEGSCVAGVTAKEKGAFLAKSAFPFSACQFATSRN
jgi:hypothetical protein